MPEASTQFSSCEPGTRRVIHEAKSGHRFVVAALTNSVP